MTEVGLGVFNQSLIESDLVVLIPVVKSLTTIGKTREAQAMQENVTTVAVLSDYSEHRDIERLSAEADERD